MFRHKGKRRSYTHNLKLASILSFVAGIVNISGLFSVGILTTNVTGHFAFFSEAFVKESFGSAVISLLFLLSFFLGAFFSNLISEFTVRFRENLSYAAPIVFEILLLLVVAILADNSIVYPNLLACILLFAMGLQNALVTRVSESVVRTTHLTGIFTDLGIELSEILFYKRTSEKFRLRKSIYLKFIIVVFFFAGGILGGLLYSLLALSVLYIACLCLTIALLYDYFLYQFYTLKRRVTRPISI